MIFDMSQVCRTSCHVHTNDTNDNAHRSLMTLDARIGLDIRNAVCNGSSHDDGVRHEGIVA